MESSSIFIATSSPWNTSTAEEDEVALSKCSVWFPFVVGGDTLVVLIVDGPMSGVLGVLEGKAGPEWNGGVVVVTFDAF